MPMVMTPARLGGGRARRPRVDAGRIAPVRSAIAHNMPETPGREGFAQLFAFLCLASGRDMQLKDLLGAIPADPSLPMGEAVLAAMANLGFEANRIPRRLSRIARLHGPILLLDPDGAAAWVVVDDPDGQRQAHGADGSVHPAGQAGLPADGSCWTFRADRRLHASSADQRKHTGYSWMRAIVAHLDGIGMTLVITNSALALGAVTVPLLVAAFYSQIMAIASLDPLPYFVLACLATLAFKSMLLTLRARTLAWFANRLDYLVSTASFDRLLCLSPSVSEGAAPKDQAARLRSFENIRDFISGPLAASILDLPIALFAMAALGFLLPSIAAILAAAVVLYLTLFWAIWRRIRVQTSVVADEATEMQRVTIETFEKADLIRQCGLQEQWPELHQRSIAREQKAQAGLQLIGAIGEAGAALFFASAVILLLARMAHLVWAGTLETGAMLAVLLVCLRVLTPFHSICLAVPRFEQARKSLAQINRLMEMKRENEVESIKRQPAPLKGALTFLNLTYRVADTRPVFVGLEIDIRPGELIGIAGANGSGKSTILKLVQGMVDSPLGAIRIDGVDLRQLPLNEVRRRISYVPQNPQLIPGSLRDNLLFANPLATEAQLQRALGLVGLAPFGWALDADLFEPGVPPPTTDFRFRLAFAQALLVGSKLWLIDELPNALLNGELGAMLQRLIDAGRGKRTMLFVSHRSDFLCRADRVIALRYGKVPRVLAPNDLFENAA